MHEFDRSVETPDDNRYISAQTIFIVHFDKHLKFLSSSHLEGFEHRCSLVEPVPVFTYYLDNVIVITKWVTRVRVASLLPCVSGDKDLLIDGRLEGELVSCACFTALDIRARTVFSVVI